MNKNKIVLEHCPNFYKIINFEYFEDDLLSNRLISLYEDYIFTIDVESSKELKKIAELDTAIAKYIDDYIFRKEMKHELLQVRVNKNEENLLEVIIANIIKIFERYQEGSTIPIYIAKWI